jgi:hypothetical protein
MLALQRFVVLATEHTEDAEMISGNVLPLRPLRPFPLIAGLLAHWYYLHHVCGTDCSVRVPASEDGTFRPAAGGIPRHMWDRLIHGSIGSFVGCAHVVLFVVQTATA